MVNLKVGTIKFISEDSKRAIVEEVSFESYMIEGINSPEGHKIVGSDWSSKASGQFTAYSYNDPSPLNDGRDATIIF